MYRITGWNWGLHLSVASLWPLDRVIRRQGDRLKETFDSGSLAIGCIGEECRKGRMEESRGDQPRTIKGWWWTCWITAELRSLTLVESICERLLGQIYKLLFTSKFLFVNTLGNQLIWYLWRVWLEDWDYAHVVCTDTRKQWAQSSCSSFQYLCSCTVYWGTNVIV